MDEPEQRTPRHRALALTLLSVVTPIPAAWSNYSHHHRPARDVRLVVVHVSEGSYGSTISWFRNRHARAAANYVVARDGRIAHMVPDNEVAWHAGNGYVNAHSIGIEHEGYTGIDGTFTDAEYRSSAQLVASLLRRYHLPVNRARVIGHNQVPDPYHPGKLGGYSHHTDPGSYWDWARYMGYVRAYRSGTAPPPRPLDVTIPNLGLGQNVTGLVAFTAVPAGEALAHVDFLVDGTVRATLAAAPYTWVWDTALEENGRHILSARAIGLDGRSAIATVVVESHTPPPPAPTVTLPELPPLTGVVTIQPLFGGGPVDHVELWIDGTLTQTVRTAPYALTWDPRTVTPGQHTLAVRAVGPKGASSATVTLVTVPPPPPAP